MLKGKTIGLCVTGSIAAYKAIYLTRLLTQAGATVRTVLTQGASRFVGAMSFSALTGQRAITDMWSAAEGGEIGHVELAHQVDILVIAPATADTLARLAQGRADDPVCAAALSTKAPVLLCPAMEDGMWHHAATQANVALLKERGATFLIPEEGALASGRTGQGRMAEPEEIIQTIHSLLGPQDFQGQTVLVTAGPTREHIDPARFISNPSTGRMGIALAQAARDRGARVFLVLGPTSLSAPHGVKTRNVTTTANMLEACEEIFPICDICIMAAAPADYRPAARHEHKLKKNEATVDSLALEKTPDILSTLLAIRKAQFVVGYAAETQNMLAYAREKLTRKNLDMIVANQIGQAQIGFASASNAVTILGKNGETVEIPMAEKRIIADRILDHLHELRGTFVPVPDLTNHH